MEKNLKNLRKQFKDQGVFYTDSKLAEKLASFISVPYKNAYDPTCGAGNLLAVLPNDIAKFGQELDEHELLKAQERLTNFTGAIGDTLEQPAFLDKRFDLIVANPPFSIKWQPEGKENDPRFASWGIVPSASKADYAFILHMLHLLADDGEIIALNFPGICYRSGREGKIRKMLIEKNYVDKVIRIGKDQFVDTSIETVILVLKKNRKNTESVLFIDTVLDKKAEVTTQHIADNDYGLSVPSYIEEEVKAVYVDPIDLENDAQQNVLRTIKTQLEISALMCEFNKMDFNAFVGNIEEMIQDFKKAYFKK